MHTDLHRINHKHSGKSLLAEKRSSRLRH